MKYNPAFLSEEELIHSFVVHHVDLELIIETIKENSGNSNQHVLIIGPRGMGKTMLVLRAAAYVSNDEELNSAWYPLVFSEESYEVWTAAEFWLRAVFHLGKQTGDENLVRLHDQLKEERDEKRLYERALACLMDFADEQRKRLLLVVENLNMLLDEQIGSDESWNIRHTLLNEPRIMLLATATSRFDEIDNSGRAMFDLFKLHFLEPLNTMESKVLWESLTGQEVEENRIRPIQILTGGNPRLLAIISSFAAGASFQELMKHLTFLIDEYTTYFKTNIESLPSLERKIFVALTNIWEPATAARVSQDARIEVNKVSSLLKRLENRGSVSVIKSEGRKKSYQVTERLYNIYHLMRISSRQADRVRAVVDFMVNFYEGEELATKMAQLTEEACSLGPDERSDHLIAYEQIFRMIGKGEERGKIIQYTKPDFFKLPGISISPGEIVSDYYPTGEHPEKPLDRESVTNKNKKENNEEMLSIKLLENPSNPVLWIKYGLFLKKRPENYERAERAFRKAIEIDPKYATGWAMWGRFLEENLERYDEAEKAYQTAIEINREYGFAWLQLVKVKIKQKHKLNQLKDTISQFLRTTGRSAESLNIIVWLILAVNFKKGYSLAVKLIEEAIEMEPESIYCQYTYASILGAQGKWEKAMAIVAEFLKVPEAGEQFAPAVVSFFIRSAVAGYIKQGLQLLKNSACAPYVEPLIVALQMMTGEEFNAPQEVVEVAKDVVKRIEEKKQKNPYPLRDKPMHYEAPSDSVAENDWAATK
jgi:tetratricopeptide (TPR) repeat protein